MVKLNYSGKRLNELDYSKILEKSEEIAKMIDEKTGLGNDFLGWLNYASTLDSKEVERINKTAERIRKNYDCLVVAGIGGSYLGARAAIEAINGLFPNDDFEIIFLGQTLSSTYISQVLRYLKGKRFAINVISKSGTTTETSVAFRMLKNLLKEQFGEAYLKDAIIATTDKARGALKKESDEVGYEEFVIPDDVGGRYSVVTPVGLIPMACANINIIEFLKGFKDGEKEYSSHDFKKNLAYQYGATRYLLHKQLGYPVEVFVTYEPQFAMITEWLKQLFAESEGKDNKAIFPASVVFTTDLHSVGQFIQEGSPMLFETIIKTEKPIENCVVAFDEKNLDGLNYLADKELSFINDKAYEGTLDAHTVKGHCEANIITIEKMDAYNLGNLFYFFMRACAFSAYLLGVNPFNQPGVEVYKKNMLHLLGKEGY